jgi:Icc-related predicted phosphoesterase
MKRFPYKKGLICLALPLILSCGRANIKFPFVDKSSTVQRSFVDESSIFKFGALGDSHGNSRKDGKFAEFFKTIGVDGIFLLGDYGRGIKYSVEVDKGMEEDIYKSIEAAAKTQLPVYVIPGNHDLKKTYTRAMLRIKEKYPNVLDMLEVRAYDGEGYNLVSNPYLNAPQYNLQNIVHNLFGESMFLGKKEDFYKIGDFVNSFNDKDPIIFFTHQPPYKTGSGKGLLGSIFQKHNKYLGEVVEREDIKFVINAHFHDGRGVAITRDMKRIKEGDFSSSLIFNVSSVCCSNRAGIFLIGKDRNGKSIASYENIYLNEIAP